MEQEKRTFLSYMVIAVKGLCMGAADVVPGVSGGTIAFVTGIYQELINSIKSINFQAFKLLFQGRIAAFWKAINGTFLVAVLTGILVSVFSLAKLMVYLLHTFPIPVWSFFMGLVVASAIYVLKDLKKWSFWDVLMLIVGVAVAIIICKLSPTETPNAYWFIFLTGAIAICAMILPGISGSFIMLLLGKYLFIMAAVSEFNVPVLLVFAMGAIIGLISFSHLLSWLLKKYYNLTVCLLAGFMLGSIEKIWPWKEIISETMQKNILPGDYTAITGQPSQLGVALLFVAIGFIIVFGVEFLAKHVQRKTHMDIPQ